MVHYQLETYEEVIEDIKPLLELHYAEVCLYPDKIALNPKYEFYNTLDDAGALRIVTARDEGVLIGYSVFFEMPHPHYQDHIYAQNDIFYVAENYRHTEVAPSLVAKAEEALHGDGVSVITYHMKTYKPFESLMDFSGYDKAEVIFSKFIKD